MRWNHVAGPNRRTGTDQPSYGCDVEEGHKLALCDRSPVCVLLDHGVVAAGGSCETMKSRIVVYVRLAPRYARINLEHPSTRVRVDCCVRVEHSLDLVRIVAALSLQWSVLHLHTTATKL